MSVERAPVVAARDATDSTRTEEDLYGAAYARYRKLLSAREALRREIRQHDYPAKYGGWTNEQREEKRQEALNLAEEMMALQQKYPDFVNEKATSEEDFAGRMTASARGLENAGRAKFNERNIAQRRRVDELEKKTGNSGLFSREGINFVTGALFPRTERLDKDAGAGEQFRAGASDVLTLAPRLVATAVDMSLQDMIPGYAGTVDMWSNRAAGEEQPWYDDPTLGAILLMGGLGRGLGGLARHVPPLARRFPNLAHAAKTGAVAGTLGKFAHPNAWRAGGYLASIPANMALTAAEEKFDPAMYEINSSDVIGSGIGAPLFGVGGELLSNLSGRALSRIVGKAGRDFVKTPEGISATDLFMRRHGSPDVSESTTRLLADKYTEALGRKRKADEIMTSLFSPTPRDIAGLNMLTRWNRSDMAKEGLSTTDPAQLGNFIWLLNASDMHGVPFLTKNTSAIDLLNNLNNFTQDLWKLSRNRGENAQHILDDWLPGKDLPAGAISLDMLREATQRYLDDIGYGISSRGIRAAKEDVGQGLTRDLMEQLAEARKTGEVAPFSLRPYTDDRVLFPDLLFGIRREAKRQGRRGPVPVWREFDPTTGRPGRILPEEEIPEGAFRIDPYDEKSVSTFNAPAPPDKPITGEGREGGGEVKMNSVATPWMGADVSKKGSIRPFVPAGADRPTVIRDYVLNADDLSEFMSGRNSDVHKAMVEGNLGKFGSSEYSHELGALGRAINDVKYDLYNEGLPFNLRNEYAHALPWTHVLEQKRATLEAPRNVGVRLAGEHSFDPQTATFGEVLQHVDPNVRESMSPLYRSMSAPAQAWNWTRRNFPGVGRVVAPFGDLDWQLLGSNVMRAMDGGTRPLGTPYFGRGFLTRTGRYAGRTSANAEADE